MDSIRDILENRADSLGDNTYDVMTEVKLVIAGTVKTEVRILNIANGTVKVATEDAAAASEIRLKTRQIMTALAQKKLPVKLDKLIVVIR